MPPTDLLPRPAISSAADSGDTMDSKNSVDSPAAPAPAQKTSQDTREGPSSRPDLFVPGVPNAVAADENAPPETPIPAPPSALTTAPEARNVKPVTAVPPPPVANSATASTSFDDCGGAMDRRCLEREDQAVSEQLQSARLAALKAARADGNWNAGRMKARVLTSKAMNADAMRDKACSKAGAEDRDFDAAYYACDVAKMREEIAGSATEASSYPSNL